MAARRAHPAVTAIRRDGPQKAEVGDAGATRPRPAGASDPGRPFLQAM